MVEKFIAYIMLGILLLILPGLFLSLLYPVASIFKFLRPLYCKIGWHCYMHDYEFVSHDGASAHCKCKWCGFEGLVDSQGDLF